MQNYLLKKMLVFGTIALFTGLIIAPSISCSNNQLKLKNTTGLTTSFNPFEEGWKYRKQITINHFQVEGNLVNFPVLVSNIDSDLRDKAQIDGDDILFMDDKGEADQLYHEIERYSGSSGELVAWVNIPILSTAVDTVFYMYYGNQDCSSQEFPEMVWDSDYIHVWHLGDNLMDSAGFDDGNNHGTSIVSGKIGKGRDFEQYESDYIDLGDMVQPGDGSLTTMTWEAWIKPETQDGIIMSKYDSSGEDYSSYFIAFVQGGKFRNTAFSAWDVSTNSITLNSYALVGQWIYLTSTWTLGSTRNIVPFIDGTEVADTQSHNNANVMKNIPVSDDIGRWRPEPGPEYTDGVMDEVRWSKIVRSDAWIETSYNTMNDPSYFLSFGPEEMNQPPNEPDIDGPISGKVGIAYPYTITSTDPEGDDISYFIRWGDGNITDWTDFQASGPPGFTESHSWDTEGTYIIQSKAKDTVGNESEWAELTVTMPRDKIVYNTLFLRFLERYPILQKMLSYLIN